MTKKSKTKQNHQKEGVTNCTQRSKKMKRRITFKKSPQKKANKK
jgi:hypothetical protein